MNFIEHIHEVRDLLRSSVYIDHLWATIRNKPVVFEGTEEDKEWYQVHLPLELTAFLKEALEKLRIAMRWAMPLNWNDFDDRYMNTLIYFVMEEDEGIFEDRIYAANLFFLLNLLNIPNKSFYFHTTYSSIMKHLAAFPRTQDITSPFLMCLMKDFNEFLKSAYLYYTMMPMTITALSNLTFCTTEYFEHIALDVSCENLAYIAFMGFLTIFNKASFYAPSKRMCDEVALLGLLDGLSSKKCEHYGESAVQTQQHNTRLFIRENFKLIEDDVSHAVGNLLIKTALNPECDDYDGLARIVQELPSPEFSFFSNTFTNLLNSEPMSKPQLLKYIVPLCRHPSLHVCDALKLRTAYEILFCIIKSMTEKEFVESSDDVVIEILAGCCKEPLGMDAIKHMSESTAGITTYKMYNTFYNQCDLNWNKIAVNVHYVTLMLHIFLENNEPPLETRTLSQLRRICLAADPSHLKSCIKLLKRLLVKYSNRPVLMFFVDIFVQMSMHQEATGADEFAREFHKFIFSNIRLHQGLVAWKIIKIFLIPSIGDIQGLFAKFHSLGLLESESITVLLESHVTNPEHQRSVLHLLYLMLSHVTYTKTTILDNMLKSWHSGTCRIEPNTVIQCIILMLEKKDATNCSSADLQSYRDLHLILYSSLRNKSLPDDCAKNAILLLQRYAQLLKDEDNWCEEICMSLQQLLHLKLLVINTLRPIELLDFKKDVLYMIDFIRVAGQQLSDCTFEKLEKIVKFHNNSPEFLAYVKKFPEVIHLCISLYTKVCLVQRPYTNGLELVISNFKSFNTEGEKMFARILITLDDFCDISLHCAVQMTPHLFESLSSNSPYLRFISVIMIADFVKDDKISLTGGLYFLFMSLIADSSILIIHRMRHFVNKTFAPVYYPIIARHFVPGIIQYNFYHDHPTIKLIENERLMLTKTFTFQDRCAINYRLYQFLPEKVQFEILGEIATEIFMKVWTRLIRLSPIVYSILDDALAVVMFTTSNYSRRTHISKYYTDGLNMIKNKLLVTKLTDKLNTIRDHRLVLGELLESLFNVLYADLEQTAQLCQNLLFAIISLTNKFFNVIKYIITKNPTLKTLYTRLEPFYKRNPTMFTTVGEITIIPSFRSDIYYTDIMHFYYYERLRPGMVTEGFMNSLVSGDQY